MSQFDVYKNPSKTSKKHLPYLLDVQNNFLEDLSTRIVIPLGLKSSFRNEEMDKLTPTISYLDEELLLLTPQISSVPASILKNQIGSLAHIRSEIINSLDFAISGI
ncbi:CcdB family protein [Porticoccus sp. W117]|uniref:CcdB family protein n=1 Tax=Porticoccus sp. W117 TaxID=3054777 RepID=UPI00259495A5|nr:CcdB family protein [Porticoccus sp. W117]MDM3871084.1 CcdB family protein [Porticoccus sp. W117]